MVKVQVNPDQKQEHCRIECQEQKKCRELARNPVVSLEITDYLVFIT